MHKELSEVKSNQFLENLHIIVYYYHINIVLLYYCMYIVYDSFVTLTIMMICIFRTFCPNLLFDVKKGVLIDLLSLPFNLKNLSLIFHL